MGRGVFAPPPIGERFGRLIVLEEVERMNANRRMRCRCDCGGEKVVGLMQLRAGKTKSCGCLHIETATRMCVARSTKHGMAKRSGRDRFWRIWVKMRERCYDRKSVNYCRYGARGVTVCDRWLDFDAFKADLYDSYLSHAAAHGVRNTTLDRYPDKRGNYEPSNVRWATYKEQTDNRDCMVLVEFRGEFHTIADWGRLTGLGGAVIANRIRKGWNVERALTEPRRITSLNKHLVS